MSIKSIIYAVGFLAWLIGPTVFLVNEQKELQKQYSALMNDVKSLKDNRNFLAQTLTEMSENLDKARSQLNSVNVFVNRRDKHMKTCQQWAVINNSTVVDLSLADSVIYCAIKNTATPYGAPRIIDLDIETIQDKIEIYEKERAKCGTSTNEAPLR